MGRREGRGMTIWIARWGDATGVRTIAASSERSMRARLRAAANEAQGPIVFEVEWLDVGDGRNKARICRLVEDVSGESVVLARFPVHASPGRPLSWRRGR